MIVSIKAEAEKMTSNINAVKKYQATRDEFKIRPSIQEGEKIRAAAAKAGESVQQYFLNAVRARMETEKNE